MRYAYIRVSTKEQHLDRQIEAIKEYWPDEVFADKLSGKNFDRPEYHRLKSLIRRGDEIIVKELDRLGRNKDAVKEELKWFKDNGVIVRVLDIPTTMIELPGQEWIAEMVNNILIEVIAAVAEQERKKIRQRQKEGIACARERGVKFGRPEKDVECVLLADWAFSFSRNFSGNFCVRTDKKAGWRAYRRYAKCPRIIGG